MENIITRTGHVLDLISQLYEKQIRNRRIYTIVKIYTEFSLLDYDSFKERVFDLDLTRNDTVNILKEIYNVAKKNITLHEAIFNSLEGTFQIGGSFRRRIGEPWNEDLILPSTDQDSGDYDPSDFILYCEKIVDSLSPIFPDKDHIQPAKATGEQVETTLPKTSVIKKQRPEKKIIPFPDYLRFGNNEHRDLVADFLKKEFKGKKGKWIAYMLMALESTKYVSFDVNTEIYKSIESFFGEDIGTDKSINKYYKKRNYITNQGFKTIQYKIAAFIGENHIITS
ncbi:MAG: hypothetical protein WCP32_11840 [Bacteroidota bacterium]